MDSVSCCSRCWTFNVMISNVVTVYRSFHAFIVWLDRSALLCRDENTDFLCCRRHHWRLTRKCHRRIDWRPECWSSCGGTQSRSLHWGSASGGWWVSSGIIHCHLQWRTNAFHLSHTGYQRFNLWRHFRTDIGTWVACLKALTDCITDGWELPILLCTHILSITCSECDPLSSPLNVKHCVDLSRKKDTNELKTKKDMEKTWKKIAILKLKELLTLPWQWTGSLRETLESSRIHRWSWTWTFCCPCQSPSGRSPCLSPHPDLLKCSPLVTQQEKRQPW